MPKFETKFLTAANVADYNVSHYIHLPEFQPGFLDLLYRKVTILNRIQTVPATGHPTRYWEQTKLPSNAGFINPRGGGTGYTGYSKDTLDEDYGRVEKSAMLRCLVSRIKFTMFDAEVVRQQGVMEQLLAKNMQDMMYDFAKVQNDKLWNGASTDLNDTTTPEYCGILKQITDNANVVASDVKIADAIRTHIANLASRLDYDVYPTAIYANPASIDLLEQEEQARNNYLRTTIEIMPGVRVPSIYTQIGELPIIPDPFVRVVDGGTTLDHRFVLVNENLIERHYLTTPAPRVFKMSQNENLIDDYIAFLWDTVIVKGADAKAHSIITKKVNKA